MDYMFKPKYKLTSKIVSMLISIAESKVIIERAKLLPKNEIKLRRQALIRMTHNSTEIEGNLLNMKQVEALFAHKKIDAPIRDIYEVENYLKALKYIGQFVQKKKSIGATTLLKIHQLVTGKILSKEQSGHYRKVPIFVVRRRWGLPDKIIYTGPNAKDVPRLCADLMEWLQKSAKQNINPIIIAGILHQEIAAIHPFVDGNGRTARAMATSVLYQRGYDFRRLFALEDYYNKDREEYYAAINTGRNYKKGVDLTSWLGYFVKGFKEEIDNVKRKVISLSFKNVNESTESKIYLDKDQLKLLDFLDQIGRMTIKEAVNVLGCPKRTAQLKLRQLKNLGIIIQTGKGPSSAYVLK